MEQTNNNEIEQMESNGMNSTEPGQNTSWNLQTKSMKKDLEQTVEAVRTAPLSEKDQRTADYLVHRMLWDQLDRVDSDDVAVNKEGNLTVKDEFDE